MRRGGRRIQGSVSPPSDLYVAFGICAERIHAPGRSGIGFAPSRDSAHLRPRRRGLGTGGSGRAGCQKRSRRYQRDWCLTCRVWPGLRPMRPVRARGKQTSKDGGMEVEVSRKRDWQ